MIALDIAIVIAILGFAVYMIVDRWCAHKEEMFRMAAQLEEIRCCYDSEQSFLDLEDDPEHIASISVAAIERVLPSMTEEERAEAERELEDDVDYARHGRGE